MARRFKVAIAPDSFKGSISARGAAEAIAEGFKSVIKGCDCRLIPMADGGEGTVDAWAGCTGARKVSAKVEDPLERPVRAVFAYDAASRTAVIEMAAASGLPLLREDERNPLITSTFGTGQLILKALDLGAREIILGIGGSATNDGGAGMAEALGVRFLDSKGRPLARGGAALSGLARIDISGIDARIARTRMLVACDVTNPLCGPSGASAVYGPQKGASKRDVRRLNAALGNLALVASRTEGLLGAALPDAPGAGAAGGLGFGLVAFCGARLKRGVEIIAQSVGLERRMRGCDLVVTGEGRMDSQTVNGKTPAGVAKAARSLGIPCIAICGCVGDGYEAVHGIGIDAVIPASYGPYDPEKPARGARERIRAAAAEAARLIFPITVIPNGTRGMRSQMG